MRACCLAVVLLAVLAASALNLALGAQWVLAVLALAWLRRRLRPAAWLVLGLVAASGVALGRADRLGPPGAASYERDERDWLLERLGRPRAGAPAPADPAAAVGARLEETRREEDRAAPAEIQRRAAAAVALDRSAGRLRTRAPAEVAALDAAVRDLALTLTSPEFRDLEARQRRAGEWLDALRTRLAGARDAAEVEGVRRALDPAALAPVSLRAVREDLDRVDAATRALVRALGGGGVSVSATARVRYDEARREIDSEARYRVGVEAPLRLVRVDASALGRPVGGSPAPGATASLLHEEDGRPPREIGGGRVLDLDPGVRRVVLVDRRTRPASIQPVRSWLKPIPFERVPVAPGDRASRALLVTVAIEGAPGLEALLAVPAGEAPVERLAVPRAALYHVTAPGRTASEDGGDPRDEWVASGPPPPGGAPLAVELVPPSALLRNRVVVRLRAYGYQPNPAAALAVIGGAALAVGLAGRPRRPGPGAA